MKPGEVEFVDADKEEEYENADAEKELDVAGGLNNPGNRAEQYTGHRVAYDRYQAQPMQQGLGQLGNDNK